MVACKEHRSLAAWSRYDVSVLHPYQFVSAHFPRIRDLVVTKPKCSQFGTRGKISANFITPPHHSIRVGCLSRKSNIFNTNTHALDEISPIAQYIILGTTPPQLNIGQADKRQHQKTRSVYTSNILLYREVNISSSTVIYYTRNQHTPTYCINITSQSLELYT